MWAPFGRLFTFINFLGSFWQRFDFPGQNERSGRSLENELPSPFVRTPLGAYKGYFMKAINGRTIYAFEGIPFSEPPERFKAPVPKKPFNGNFSALNYGKDCVQTYSGIIIKPDHIIYGSENCLTCHFYTPMISHNGSFPNYPVLLNIYGGSFLLGSSNDYGPAYLLEKDIVLINCNYRIGVMGFFSTGDSAASGNWGLKDIALAVDFVHSNVRYFGGNPDKIVLFGQSAGAALIHLLSLSPFAHEGKFKGLILSSGNALVPWGVLDPAASRRLSWRFAVANFCPTNKGSQAIVDCLRKRSKLRLAALSNLMHVTEMSIFHFRPVVEPKLPGALITDSPENIYMKGNVPNIPMIISVNDIDMDAFNVVFRALRFPYFLTIPSVIAILPEFLELKGKVQGRETQIANEIVDFYGGKEMMVKNRTTLFKLASDWMFHVSYLKSVTHHSFYSNTFPMKFGYKSQIGYAARFDLNPKEFGVGHCEELFFIFNRTDIKPISKSDKEYEVVKLFQSLILNFVNNGSFEYDTEFGLIEIAKPVDPLKPNFEMFLVENDEFKVVERQKVDNISTFWNSLGIDGFPSLR